MSSEFDVVVVGAGMFGSSTARYLREAEPALSVALLGPANNVSDGARGQHYDVARICRTVDSSSSPEWTIMNAASAHRYRDIESRSGVEFYTSCGLLWIADPADRAAVLQNLASLPPQLRPQLLTDAPSDPLLLDWPDEVAVVDPVAANANSHAVPPRSCTAYFLNSHAAAEAVFGGAVSTAAFHCIGTCYICETGAAGAGTVNPSKLVAAQQVLAAAARAEGNGGFTYVDDVATGVTWSDARQAYAVSTLGGRLIHAGKVVVAAGAFSTLHPLCPGEPFASMEERRVDVALHGEAIVLVQVHPPSEVTSHEAATAASAKLPSVIRTNGEADEKFYCLPPRYYKDREGWFIKMALGNATYEGARSQAITTVEDAVRWSDGVTAAPPEAVQRILSLLPKLYTGWTVVSDAVPVVLQCVWDLTPHGRPYIGCFGQRKARDTTDRALFTTSGTPQSGATGGHAIESGWYAVIGGNGKGAKCCDEVGRLGALAVLGATRSDPWLFGGSYDVLWTAKRAP